MHLDYKFTIVLGFSEMRLEHIITVFGLTVLINSVKRSAGETMML